MKVKFTIVAAIVCMLLMSLSCCAQEYVIKLNDTIQLFSESSSPSDRFVTVDESELGDYIDAGIVEYCEPVAEGYIIDGAMAESQQESASTTDLWNHTNISAQFPLSIGAHGTRVKVAVIDSGVNIYSALSGKVLEGYDYYTESADVTDTYGHGTFVSSIIASSMHSFAYRSYIVPLKVDYESIDEDGNTVHSVKSNYVMRAIYDAVDKYDCDVINMSLTLGASAEELTHIEEAIKYAVENGVIVIAAVGNYGDEKAYYPAAYDNVIGVGSVNEENEHSSFSQTNSSVFVVAPGEGVVSSTGDTDENGEVISFASSGTSFAAPHVSALAAVIKCIKPTITNEEFKTLISQTADNLGDDEGYDKEFGYGIINCEKAVKSVIKDRKIFISPIVIQEGKSTVWLYNNTQSDMTFWLVYISDSSETPIRVVPIPITAGFAGAMPALQYNGGSVKYMAWDSFANLIPLSPASAYSE